MTDKSDRVFKGYNKKNTSSCMMRIDKREIILSVLCGQARLYRPSLDVAEKLYEKSKRKKQNRDWQIKNLTVMEIFEPIWRRDYYDWKVKMINKTGWLYNFNERTEGEMLLAQWYDTRKLRIYYRWLHKNGQFTLERVLKYMYSPLFPAILIMERGYLHPDRERLIIEFNFNHDPGVEMLSRWFWDILEIRTSVYRDEERFSYLFIDDDEMKKTLELLMPVIEKIPSMHERFYQREASRLYQPLR